MSTSRGTSIEIRSIPRKIRSLRAPAFTNPLEYTKVNPKEIKKDVEWLSLVDHRTVHLSDKGITN